MGVTAGVWSAIKRRPWVVLAMVLALVISAGVVAVRTWNDGRTAADCSVLRAETSDDAGLLARDCGSEVEVMAERSPWMTVFAKPDGSAHMTVSTLPIRTNVNGTWEDLDTTIATETRVSSDTAIGHGAMTGGRASTVRVFAPTDLPAPPGVERMLPVQAPVFPTWLNPGGDAGADSPLGVIQVGDQWVALRFPLALPAPTLSGRFATYALATGVRLVVSIVIDGSGFSPIVELDSWEAAVWFRDALANARTASGLPGAGLDIPYMVESSAGLELREVDGAGFELVDGSGAPVFGSPTPFIWDSAADNGADGPQERVGFPVQGDRIAQMPAALVDSPEGHQFMVISPDAALLADDDTVWPVHIDPTLTASTATQWMKVQNNGGVLYKWVDSPSRVGESMGTCLTSWASSCGSNWTARLVWEFNNLAQGSMLSWMTALAGADITSASFSADPGQRGNCASTQTDLYWTGAITSSSNWNSITWIQYLSNVVGPQGDACTDAGVRRGWDVTGTIRMVADGNYNGITLGLKANNESNSNGYKTYNYNAWLDINYNRAPNKPTDVKLISPSTPCVSGSGRPWINTAAPTMSAVVSDPDGGTVQGYFQIVNAGTETEAWNSGLLAGLSSGSASTVAVPAGKLVSGNSYGYRATSMDPGGAWSGWSTSTCEFSVDTVKPDPPTTAPVRTGVAAIYEPNVERGGVGLPGKFTLNRGVSTDVVSLTYQFGSDTPANVTPDASGNAVIAYTPTTAGPVTLTVTATDRAGNTSQSTYSFKVAAAKEDAIWMLDEGAGTSAADTSGVSAAQTLTTIGTTWGTGPHALFASRAGDNALVFNGSSSYAATGPVVKTQNSFVISAYVWLNASSQGSATYTVVSQDGVTQSAFELGYTPTCALTGGCWTFAMKDTDTSGAAATAVTSTTPVAGDRWVHLVGAHDATAKTMKLWVCDIGVPSDPGDGNPVSTATSRVATAWTAAGALTIGRGLVDGAANNWWPGRVDNVRVFSGQIVSEAKIRRMCQGAEARDFSNGAEALDPTSGN